MVLGMPGRPPEPLYIIPMALALALAAFGGAALGLVWHSVGGTDTPPAQDIAPPAEEG